MSNKKTDNADLFSSWNLSRINYLIFGIGILVIILGYLIMAAGETTSFLSVKLAPAILVIGYCIIIPISIWYKPGDKEQI